MNSLNIDHLLVIGFGAPERQEDVPEFLKIVTRGIPVPEERLREVVHHYEAIGGGSPYNRHTKALVDALTTGLSRRGISLPVFTGMRNWHPFMKDIQVELKERGLRKGVGIILAPHRSDASWEKYLRTVEEAKKETASEAEYIYLPPWHDHPGFIKAQADLVRKSLPDQEIHLLFSAHSIPVEMAQKSRYPEEFRTSCELVARELGCSDWSLAYQSRSGSPRQPWLEPDVNSVIHSLAKRGIKNVMLVPVGFLCDNAEVLYDLDIEARLEAEKAGLGYFRASTVMDHPLFTEMLVELTGEILT